LRSRSRSWSRKEPTLKLVFASFSSGSRLAPGQVVHFIIIHLEQDQASDLNPEVGTRNFFLSPQSQFRNLKEDFRNRNFATFQEILLHNRNSAIPQLQFFLKSATSSLQLENLASAIFGIFLAMKKQKI
jgi:hypothetical protein